MLRIKFLLPLAAAVMSAASKPCPLLGPVFEAPKGIANCSVFQGAIEALREALDNATDTGMTPLGPWAATNNSFSIGVFDTTSTDQLFSYQYTSPVLSQSTQGVTKLDENSIYRVGSLSKLIVAYIFMMNAGPSHWNDKITSYIPELEMAAKKCSAPHSSIDCTDWDSITLGALASHLAGVPRDYSTPAELLDPITLGAAATVALGFPPLPDSALPPCGLLPNAPCELEDYLAGYTLEAPTFAPGTTPTYANGGFVLLAAALEKIAGRTLSDMSDELFKNLNMTNSSYSNPVNLDNAVIPLGVSSGYEAKLGALIPAGGYFSTEADLSRLGRSILASKELSPAETRQWMKPVTFTSSTTSAVGMPWEITRVPDLLNDHVFDLYTKTGDVLAYSSHLILAPDYNLGFIILAAGNDTGSVRTLLAEVVTASLFPALEQAARQQAQDNYAGTYKSTDANLDSEVVLATQRGLPGLKVEKWISNGTDTFAQLLGPDTDIRLYPTDLIQPGEDSTQQIAYRAVWESASTESLSGIFSPQCQTWGTVGSPAYGSVALDQIVFTVKDGRAISMTPKAWRMTLREPRA